MPQLPEWTLPDWRRPVEAVTGAAQRFATDCAERGRQTTSDAVTKMTDFVGDVTSDVRRRVMSFALEDFFDELTDQEERSRETLRTELREELQVFATAVGDGMFAMAVPDTTASAPRRRSRTNDALDWIDDDIDLEGFDDLDYADG